MIFKQVIIKNLAIIGDVKLDYDVEIRYLKEEDTYSFWEATGFNYSLTGLCLLYTSPSPRDS